MLSTSRLEHHAHDFGRLGDSSTVRQITHIKAFHLQQETAAHAVHIEQSYFQFRSDAAKRYVVYRINTRNSSGDEIANVNFLYLDIVHVGPTTKHNRLVHKFRHRSTRLCVGTHVYQIEIQ